MISPLGRFPNYGHFSRKITIVMASNLVGASHSICLLLYFSSDLVPVSEDFILRIKFKYQQTEHAGRTYLGMEKLHPFILVNGSLFCASVNLDKIFSIQFLTVLDSPALTLSSLGV